MKEEVFSKGFRKWREENEMQKTEFAVECISIEEIYRAESINLNRSYYQYIVDAQRSKTGAPAVFMYSSLDLLEVDRNGDIISVTPIDYQIIR